MIKLSQRLQAGLLLIVVGHVFLCVAYAGTIFEVKTLEPWTRTFVCVGMGVFVAGTLLAFSALKKVSSFLPALFGAAALALAVAQAFAPRGVPSDPGTIHRVSPIALFLVALIALDWLLLSIDIDTFGRALGSLASGMFFHMFVTFLCFLMEAIGGWNKPGEAGFSEPRLVQIGVGVLLFSSLITPLIAVFTLQGADYPAEKSVPH